jgi:hypothetical protein
MQYHPVSPGRAGRHAKRVGPGKVDTSVCIIGYSYELGYTIAKRHNIGLSD